MKRHFQGMIQIVRFNPWFYLAGAVTLMVGTVLLLMMWALISTPLHWAGVAGLCLATWWLAASLVVSYLVYDRSDWSRGEWFAEVAGGSPFRRVLNVHCGFDETTSRLRNWLPNVEVVALDLFDPVRLTETSIHRARALLPPEPGTLTGSPEQWPVPAASFDVICFLLSAHEYRRASERADLFRRASESLRPGGIVILAEHGRDVANFAAFGPGFLHFHSPAAWSHAWSEAGLTMLKQRRVTSWLRVWSLHLSHS